MLKLSLVTPEKRLLIDVPIEEVSVPGFMGQLTILPGHAPLITTLSVGTLKYRLAGEKDSQQVVISWGYCEVSPGGISVLAETAETKDEIDRERAEIALKRAQAKLGEPSLEPDAIRKFQRKIERARLRLAASEDKK